MGEERLSRGADWDTETVTGSQETPVGGGTAVLTLTFSNLADIAHLLDLRITSLDPTGVEVDAPQATISGNEVGVTLNTQGAGTTVSVSATGIE